MCCSHVLYSGVVVFLYKITFFELQVLLDAPHWKMIYTLLKGKGRKDAGVVRLWAHLDR